MKKTDNTKSDIESITPFCNIVVDMIRDNRIPLDIRREYAKKIQHVFPAIMLISYDHIEKKKYACSTN